jgi:hypothetical protein
LVPAALLARDNAKSRKFFEHIAMYPAQLPQLHTRELASLDALLNKPGARIQDMRGLTNIQQFRFKNIVHETRGYARNHICQRTASPRRVAPAQPEARMRAERRAGECLRDMAERGERRGPHGNNLSSDEGTQKLSDLGVTKKQSHNWQKLAEMPDEAFEARATPLAPRIAIQAQWQCCRSPADPLWANG